MTRTPMEQILEDVLDGHPWHYFPTESTVNSNGSKVYLEDYVNFLHSRLKNYAESNTGEQRSEETNQTGE